MAVRCEVIELWCRRPITGGEDDAKCFASTARHEATGESVDRPLCAKYSWGELDMAGGKTNSATCDLRLDLTSISGGWAGIKRPKTEKLGNDIHATKCI